MSNKRNRKLKRIWARVDKRLGLVEKPSKSKPVKTALFHPSNKPLDKTANAYRVNQVRGSGAGKVKLRTKAGSTPILSSQKARDAYKEHSKKKEAELLAMRRDNHLKRTVTR